VPYFVEVTAVGVPGLLGLFIAGLTSASMRCGIDLFSLLQIIKLLKGNYLKTIFCISSSLSSGLSALSSITTYDYVSKLWPHLSDAKLSRISKLNTFVLGMVSFGFVFVV